VTDPRTGQLIGAIDLTCFAGESTAFLLPLARYAGRDIEQRLVDDLRLNERALVQHFLELRRRTKGPVVLVSAGRMFANAAANRLVSPADAAELWDLGQTLSMADSTEWLPVVVGGRPLLVVSEPVADGGVVLGFALRLLPGGETPESPGAGGTPGWLDLSQTERSVAELVALGLTNREIGERLFMSRFTVDSHLRSIFRKVGVRSRVELTSRLPAASA
jgi:DNA-binding CsgD family transcriptional regulator